MSDHAIEFDKVVAGYGDFMILNNLSFKARRGAITLLIGPNGAGKSTVLKTLFGLLKQLNQTRRGSFVVIEHNMDFVMDLCHRILVMVEGQVLAVGTPAEIRANKQVLDAYLGN